MDFVAAAMAKQSSYSEGAAAAMKSAAWGIASPHARNVAQYIYGEISVEEYERREGIRLAREAGLSNIGTAA